MREKKNIDLYAVVVYSANYLLKCSDLTHSSVYVCVCMSVCLSVCVTVNLTYMNSIEVQILYILLNIVLCKTQIGFWKWKRMRMIKRTRARVCVVCACGKRKVKESKTFLRPKRTYVHKNSQVLLRTADGGAGCWCWGCDAHLVYVQQKVIVIITFWKQRFFHLINGSRLLLLLLLLAPSFGLSQSKYRDIALDWYSCIVGHSWKSTLETDGWSGG